MNVPTAVVVAATLNNGIGVVQGSAASLPWRLSREMAYFAKVTSEAPAGRTNAVVMGRKTWDSIPRKFKPLRNRVNIVLSRDKQYQINPTLPNSSPATVCENFEGISNKILELESRGTLSLHRIFIIGGASIYEETLETRIGPPLADRILLTRILSPEFPDCNVFFPINLLENETKENEWVQSSFEELQDWVGFEVPRGVQEENGIKYEFQMWLRQ